jgi:hypothetical protein
VLANYGLNKEEVNPLINRALAPQNSGQWVPGLMLAAVDYDDAFAARFIAIATGTNTPDNARGAAIKWLPWNRMQGGVTMLKSLLNDPDPKIWSPLASTIAGIYSSRRGVPGESQRPAEIFQPQEVRPLIERMLSSSNQEDWFYAVNLAGMSGDDALTPKLLALATTPHSAEQYNAICALALNRTDEGVKTLKTLLSDPDPGVSGAGRAGHTRSLRGAQRRAGPAAAGG